MRVYVVGKRHVKGEKDGSTYEYVIAHCQYAFPEVEGVAVESIRLYSRLINPADVLIKTFYDVDRDSTGRVIQFSISDKQ